MSFAFGFSGDDIEDDGEEGLSTEMSKHTISEGGGLDVASIQPKVHSLEDLVRLFAANSYRKPSVMHELLCILGGLLECKGRH